MNLSAIVDESAATGGEVPLTLDAVLIYEDLGAGLRGNDVLECIARLFPMALQLNLAMVGDKKWEEVMSMICNPFTAASIRYFDHAAIAEARAWLEQK
jgi:hypothetical protein